MAPSAALEAVLSEFSTLVVPASRLERPSAPMVPSGIVAVDELTGGLPRGCLTEICGPASCGRTSLLLAAIAQATERQETCALVDTSDCFDPLSAQQAGIDLDRLLWVRCRQPAEQHSAFGVRHSANTKPHRGTERNEAASSRWRSMSGDSQSKIKNQKSTIEPIPEINVLTRPEQRYRDLSHLKQGDYREAWEAQQAGLFGDKMPPQSERSAAIFKSEIKNRKSEFESGEWLFRPERTSPAMRAELSRIDQALKVTDLLLQSGGFGLIALDLGNIAVRNARRVPLTSWFRFRRAVENTPTVLLVLEREAHARSCASLVLQLSAISRQQPAQSNHRSARIHMDQAGLALRRGSTRMDADRKSEITNQNSEMKMPSHAELLTGIDLQVEIARGERKACASVRTEFSSESAWSA
jgi:recombination protein RecA